MFGWFPSEILTNECYLIDSSLPTFSLTLPRGYHIEHLRLRHRLYLLDGYCPSTCLFLSLLFDGVGENSRRSCLLSIHQICGNGALLNLIHLHIHILLLVGFKLFLHPHFLDESFPIEDFGLESSECLGLFGNDMSLPGLFLPSPLFSV